MTPGPVEVPDRVLSAMTRHMISHRSGDFKEIYERVEAKLKKIFKTENKIFILTSSGTGGVEASIANIVEKGRKYIVLVYGEFGKRIREKIEVYGGIPIVLSSEVGDVPPLEKVKEALDESGDAEAIFIVYNETSTGVTNRLLPLISREAKKRGLLTIVDAVSILGGDILPVDEWKLDIVVTGSQKCLACPPGLSMISVSDEALKIAENKAKNTVCYYFSFSKLNKFYERKETPFTPAIPLFYALDEATSMILEEGLDKRIHRHRVCAQAFYNALKELGLSIVPKREEFRSNTVIAFWTGDSIDSNTISNELYTKWNICVARGIGEFKHRMIRLGNMGWIGRKEVILTLTGISSILLSHEVITSTRAFNALQVADKTLLDGGL